MLHRILLAAAVILALAVSTAIAASKFEGYLEPLDLPVIDAASPIARGVALSRHGDDQGAIDIFLSAAEAGDATAATNAGLLLVVGEGIQLDRVRGRTLLKIAAAAGDGFAMVALGGMAELGIEQLPDRKDAIEFYRQASTTIAAPEAYSRWAMAKYFEDSSNDQNDWRVSRDICQHAFDLGNRFAILNCMSINPHESTDDVVRNNFNLAASISSWSSDLNLRKYYVDYFFTDEDQWLIRDINSLPESFLDYYAINRAVLLKSISDK